MKILILNGPNINFIGIREKNIYGQQSYEDIVAMIQTYAKEKGIDVDVRQSNHEGVLIDWLQEAYFAQVDGVIINPGAYTHYSIALMDCLKSIQPIPAIEVHLSDIHQRESYRHVSYTSYACIEQVMGLGAQGYLVAIDRMMQYLA